MEPTYVLRVSGMHCGSCALLIDDTLEDIPGVRSSQTSAKQGRTSVQTQPGQCDVEEITAAIKELGYTPEIQR